MIRISALTLFATVLLLGASTARADGISVHVSGRPIAQVRADILRAARTVCAADDAQFPGWTAVDCVHETVAQALRQLAAADAGYALASN